MSERSVTFQKNYLPAIRISSVIRLPLAAKIEISRLRRVEIGPTDSKYIARKPYFHRLEVEYIEK